MTKKIIIHKGVAVTCRDCIHAILVRTEAHNPVLAQCKLRPTMQHPHSNYVVNVASAPACTMFGMSDTPGINRPVSMVNWRGK